MSKLYSTYSRPRQNEGGARAHNGHVPFFNPPET